MAETPATTTAKKKLKKKVFRLGLSMVKPLLLFGVLLLIADGCALAGFIHSYEVGGMAAALYGCLFTALTTALLLLISGVIYQLCSLKAKMALHLLEDMKGLLRKTEQTLHHHIQAKQEKDFRHTVRLALENMQTDTEEQKKILQQLRADSASLDSTAAEPSPKEQVNRLERLSNFLNQSVDTFVYLQQIYQELQQLGLIPKRNSTPEKAEPNNNKNNHDNDNDKDDIVLQEILTEINRLQEQLETIHLSK